jgi:hypothetical protein
MDFKSLVQKLDPDIYHKLKIAIAIGKWPDGRMLSDEQKMLSMQAVIAYEIEHNFPENERVGYVDTAKSECHTEETEATPLKWRH